MTTTPRIPDDARINVAHGRAWAMWHSAEYAGCSPKYWAAFLRPDDRVCIVPTNGGVAQTYRNNPAFHELTLPGQSAEPLRTDDDGEPSDMAAVMRYSTRWEDYT